MANLLSESLNGKVILVTGAAKRIGREIALRLAREGAKVAIHYNTSREEAERTAADCGAVGLFSANLESVDDIRLMFDEVGERLTDRLKEPELQGESDVEIHGEPTI